MKPKNYRYLLLSKNGRFDTELFYTLIRSKKFCWKYIL